MAACRAIAAAPLVACLASAQTGQLRPPAVPLVACDPYFSIWSRADRLTDVATTHWTGKPNRLRSLIRIDGQTYRLMGDEPEGTRALSQVSVQVLPTRTIYRFRGSGVGVQLTFMTPALPEDVDLLSRPVTYLTWDVRPTDGRNHDVKLFFDALSEIAKDEPSQSEAGRVVPIPGLAAGRVGTQSQRILGKTGDDRRIDWGYLYAAAPKTPGLRSGLTFDAAQSFVRTGGIPAQPSERSLEKPLVTAFAWDLKRVTPAGQSRWMMLAYDDLYSVQYFRQNLRPYWRRNGMTAEGLLSASARDYAKLKQRCGRFDSEMLADLRRVGGERYAQICALAYRQCFAGNKIAADAKGQPLLFPKENTSNGCIATVDVIFPMAPQFLLFGPSLTKAMLVSNLDYASSPRWRWPFAPHDLGTYPKANGQVYGGGERTEENQMPVEETGNMLILLAALGKMEGNADFAAKYWPTLTKWAEYLRAKGFDPENQLSTDDFMGHLAHNTNLSIKATLGLASYGYLCDLRGRKAEGKRYRDLARGFAQRWSKEAWEGDHSKLAFDKPGTWSQKYNLVWDRILDFNLYPKDLVRKEVAFYRHIAHPYGVPLDSRKGGVQAKVDWSLWTACLTGSRADFDAIVEPVYHFLNDSPERLPMSDWYDTATGHQVGFYARPVVGGSFLRLLYEPKIWRKWASRDRTRAAGWAPLPKPPVFRSLVPTSERSGQPYRYTTSRPDAAWHQNGFDDAGWSSGEGGFGTSGTPGITVRTRWDSPDIWVRREFHWNAVPTGEIDLALYHDEDAEVYLNGTLIARESGWTTTYEEIPLGRFRSLLKPGKNVVAIHCHQTGGGQGVDFGLVQRVK